MFKGNRLTAVLFWISALMTGLMGVLMLLGYRTIFSLLQQHLFPELNERNISQRVSPAAFSVITFYAMGIFALAAGLLYWSKNKNAPLYGFGREIIAQTKATLAFAKRPEYLIILAIPTIAGLYMAVSVPVGYDEALTYIFFSSRPPIVSIAYYPFPNNHILHSLLTSFFKYAPLPDQLSLRLPAWIAQMTARLLAIRFVHERYGNKVAVVVVGIASTLFFALYYSFMSRGYALVNVFFLTSLYCSHLILDQKPHRWSWIFFTLSNALGFWTMPSFLYPFITLHLWLFFSSRSYVLQQTVSGFFTIVLVALLYAPILILDGLSAVIGNPYVIPISRIEVLNSLPGFLGQTLSEITGFHWSWSLPFLIITGLYLLMFDRKTGGKSFLIWITAVPVLLLLHGVIPFPRTFAYYGFLICLFAGLAMKPLLQKWSIGYLASAAVLLQAFLLLHFTQTLESYEERDPQINFTAHKVVERILAPGKSYLSAGALAGTNLLYEIKTRKIQSARVDFQENAVNADTAASYDYIILGTYLDSTQNRKPIISNFYYNVYEKGR